MAKKVFSVSSINLSNKFSKEVEALDKSEKFLSLLIPTLLYIFVRGRDTGLPSGSVGYNAIILFSYL